MLSGIGITFVTRLAPTLAMNQVTWLFLSVAAMVVTLFVVRNLDELADYKFTIGIIGVALILLPMVFGTEQGGSKLWLRLGSFSFQPGELAKIAIVLFLASFFAANRELLSVSSRKIGPLTLPRPRMLAPVLCMWGLSLLIVVFERDLGSALLFFTIFVVMIYVTTGRASYVLISVALPPRAPWAATSCSTTCVCASTSGSTPSPTPKAAASRSCSRSTPGRRRPLRRRRGPWHAPPHPGG